MDISQGPAVLGGIIIWGALGAWALGRWQGDRAAREGLRPRATVPSRAPLTEQAAPATCAAPPALDPAPLPPAAPCHDAARDELRVALAAAPCLIEVHEEITAYRRAEQVLAGWEDDMLRLDPLPRRDADRCRFLGLTGKPTCGIVGAARADCETGLACANAVLRAERQPSPVVPGLTRV